MGEPASGDRVRHLLTAFTAFSLVLGQQISVPVALGAVFLMGVLFTVISATGIRSWILRNLPQGVAHGTGIGIGLFLLLIAANGVGLVIKNPLDGLPVALGNFASFPVIMSLVGLAVIIGFGKTESAGRHSADHYRRVHRRPDLRPDRSFLRDFRHAVAER